MKVKILIDAASDVNAEEAQKMGVELVPIEVRFGEEQYLDGVVLITPDKPVSNGDKLG